MLQRDRENGLRRDILKGRSRLLEMFVPLLKNRIIDKPLAFRKYEKLRYQARKDGSAQEFAKCSIGGQLSVSAKTKPTSGGEIALWAATRRQHR